MFFLKLLQRQVGSCFVIAHVVIPCLREFQELSFLGSLNVLQLLLLGSANVVLLSLGFLSQELFELGARLPCLSVITLLFALASVLLQEAEEVKHFRISLNVGDAAWLGRRL